MTALLSLDQVGVVLDGRPIVRDVDLEVRHRPGGRASSAPTARASRPCSRPSSGSTRSAPAPSRCSVRRCRGSATGSASATSRSAPTSARGVPATVREVVASGRIARRRPFVPDDAGRPRRRRPPRWTLVGLGGRAGHTVATLSGGQQQRVLVARTLAGEPELLLLDEPNAGVDHASQEAIAETLGGRRRAGASVVVVLHELGPFAPLIDRVIALREGRVDLRRTARPAGTTGAAHAHHHHDDDASGCAPDAGAAGRDR